MTPSLQSARPVWYPSWKSLRFWYKVYLACWLGGAVLAIVGAGIASGGSERAGAGVTIVGAILFFGSLIPYVTTMTYAYRVQRSLRNAGIIKEGGWHVVVAALIVNPYILGFYVPLSVSLAARRAAAQSARTQGVAG